MPNLIKIIANIPVTVSLVLTNIAVSLLAFSSRDRYLKWVLHPYSVIKSREYFRIFTSGFVHNDIIHLLINSAMIALICGELESFLHDLFPFGSLLFMGIYLISHVTGAAVVIWSNHRNFDHSSAGASGSILGCIMGFTILAPDYIAFYLPEIGAVKNLYAALVVIVGLIVYKWRSGNEMVDHEMHFFSALGGISGAVALKAMMI